MQKQIKSKQILVWLVVLFSLSHCKCWRNSIRKPNFRYSCSCYHLWCHEDFDPKLAFLPSRSWQRIETSSSPRLIKWRSWWMTYLKRLLSRLQFLDSVSMTLVRWFASRHWTGPSQTKLPHYNTRNVNLFYKNPTSV